MNQARPPAIKSRTSGHQGTTLRIKREEASALPVKGLVLGQHAEPEAAAERRLVFPRQALDQAARSKPCRLVHEIERTLDMMQSRLDDLKDDVKNFRFPIASDTPPPPPLAAA